MPRQFSLLTCARDPDPILFDRLIAGVEALVAPSGWTCEWIIVDHRSRSPLRRREALADALARLPWIRVVEDDSARISGARARSIEESAGDALIVLDDDCVPAPGYLVETAGLLDAHPEVQCWGPGTVTLDWMDATPPAWLDARWRTTFFQERRQTVTSWANERGWPACYASGVGMVITRGPAAEYARRVRSGRYRAVERSTATVIRGEDAQLLWTAVLAGGAAGSSPQLALRHAVPARRLEPGYLRRLAFGLQESALPCQVEVFGLPDAGLPGRGRAVREVVRTLLRAVLARQGRLRLEVAEGLGQLVAVWRVHEAPEPWWLRGLIAVAGVR